MAQYEDLIIDQGSDVEIKLELFNPDGTAKILNRYVEATNSIVPLFSATGKIKKGFNSTDSNTFNFGTTTLSPTNEENCVFLSLTNVVTNSMKAGRYVYDVEITQTSTGQVTRVIEGIITIRPNVTT